MKIRMNAKVMLSAAMAIFGTLAVFTRNISVSSGELALYRAIMAAILLTGYLAATKQKIDFKGIKKEIPLLLFSGETHSSADYLFCYVHNWFDSDYWCGKPWRRWK